MKRLRYVRHGDKEGQLIGQEGLDSTQKKTPKGNYTDLFYGPLYRTLQTILAAVCSFGCKARVHYPIEQVGTTDLFTGMITPGFKETVKRGSSNLEAIDKVHKSSQVKKWEKMAAQGVERMFDLIPEDGHGLCYGHDPVIPLAARAFGTEDVQSLDELEYIDFIQTDAGRIHVTKLPTK